MYEMDYEKAKMAFAKKGRIDDGINGSFEVVGKVNLAIEVDLNNKVSENDEKFAAYYFYNQSDDAIRKLYLIDMCKKLSKKYCLLITAAPKKEWMKADFKNVDKIVINRYDVDDEKNSKKLGESALTVKDYKKMHSELKAKCAFKVDCEKAGILKVDDLKDFIKFAEEVGIKEIVFVAEKELKHIDSNEQVEFKPADFEECIRRIRSGEKLRQRNIETLQIPNGVPLFITMRDLLIKEGGHFLINKSISEKDQFFTKLTVDYGGINVVFKQKLEDKELQLEMWRHSLSHKYIVEF